MIPYDAGDKADISGLWVFDDGAGVVGFEDSEACAGEVGELGDLSPFECFGGEGAGDSDFAALVEQGLDEGLCVDLVVLRADDAQGALGVSDFGQFEHAAGNGFRAFAPVFLAHGLTALQELLAEFLFAFDVAGHSERLIPYMGKRLPGASGAS